jgi:hypothetical protein
LKKDVITTVLVISSQEGIVSIKKPASKVLRYPKTSRVAMKQWGLILYRALRQNAIQKVLRRSEDED